MHLLAVWSVMYFLLTILPVGDVDNPLFSRCLPRQEHKNQFHRDQMRQHPLKNSRYCSADVKSRYIFNPGIPKFNYANLVCDLSVWVQITSFRSIFTIPCALVCVFVCMPASQSKIQGWIMWIYSELTKNTKKNRDRAFLRSRTESYSKFDALCMWFMRKLMLTNRIPLITLIDQFNLFQQDFLLLSSL